MNNKPDCMIEVVDISTIQKENIDERICPIPEEVEAILKCFADKWSLRDYSDDDLKVTLIKVQEKLFFLMKKWNKKIKINLSEKNRKISELYNEIEKQKIDSKFILFCKSVSISSKNVDSIIKQHKIILLFYLRDIYHAIDQYLMKLKEQNGFTDILKFKVFYLLKLIQDIVLQMIEFFSWYNMVKTKKTCMVKGFMVRKQHTHDLLFSTLNNLYRPPLYEPRDIIPANLFNYRLILEEILRDALKIKQVIKNNKLYNLQFSELIEIIKGLEDKGNIDINSFTLEELKCLAEFTNPFIHQAAFHFYWQIFYVRAKFYQLFANNYYKIFNIKLSIDEYKDYLRNFFKNKFNQKAIIVIKS